MSLKEKFKTPVGRLVQGSLLEPRKTDAENRPLTYRTGTNVGQPRGEYYFAMAVPKGPEQHWAETPWGGLIWKVGHTAFPNNASHSNFAWKIINGDSTEPNRENKKPCDIEGFKGNWVLKFKSTIIFPVWDQDLIQQITQSNIINLGSYIEVYGSVSGNNSAQQPGVYLNPLAVAFRGYGKRIFVGIDPKAVGFGESPLPPGASATPFASEGTELPAVSSPSPVVPPIPKASVTPPVAPHRDILSPPLSALVAPVKKMTNKATGTYDQYIEMGWTDAQLIQHGFLEP